MKTLCLTFLFSLSFIYTNAQEQLQTVPHRNDETAHYAKPRIYSSRPYQASDSNYIFTVAEQMPKYPGDLYKFLADSIKYPEKEREKNITGTVYATFVIEKDGSVSGIKVLRGVPGGPGLDAEAVRVLSMMKKWTPGMQNGVPVRVQYTIPIRFQLQ